MSRFAPARLLSRSTDLARDNYRAFLELVSMIPSSARRRCVGWVTWSWMRPRQGSSLKISTTLSSSELQQCGSALSAVASSLIPIIAAMTLFCISLARAYEIGGRNDESLQVLNELVDKYPDTQLIDEVQFRRGEMLFLRKNYNDAELAYKDVSRLRRQHRASTSSRCTSWAGRNSSWAGTKIALSRSSNCSTAKSRYRVAGR